MTGNDIDYNVLASSGYPAQKVAAGEVVFSAGDHGDEMYIVRSGEIEILHKERLMDTVGPNGIFGEMALIDGSARSAMARAKTDSELIAINEKGFIFFVTEMPYFALNVMRTLAARLRNMNELA